MSSAHWPLVVWGIVFLVVGALILLKAPKTEPQYELPRLFVGQKWFLWGIGAKIFAFAWLIPGAVMAIVGLMLSK